MQIIVEYVWLDGSKPHPSLRSKTKVFPVTDETKTIFSISDIPEWSFDGSSTGQATGSKSDCILKPVRLVLDQKRGNIKNSCLVLCEVCLPDNTPHSTNTRASFADDQEVWFGFEQEYVFIDPNTNKPLGFPKDGYPNPQGQYYCSVGHGNVVARKVAEEHMEACLEAGIMLTGINSEAMLGQWEYQVFAVGAKKAADDCWLSRYFLYRIAEKHNLKVSLQPKPVSGDWNGSGLHTNFSNKAMREVGGEEMLNEICEKLKETHEEHIKVYGSDNILRLSGKHETQHVDNFSYGVSDRGASIRIPIGVVRNGWKGYLEDRRPAANADPYLVVSKILQTLKE